MGLPSAYGVMMSLAPKGFESTMRWFLDKVVAKAIAYIIFIWALVGLFYLFKYFFTVLSAIWARVFRPAKNLKKYGQWAVVTGSTDGIGEGIAFELARKGLNIVLISRSLEKLQKTSEKIKAKYPKVEVKTIDIDFARFDSFSRSKIETELKELDVGVLVNNVGVSYPFPKYFHELSEERVHDLTAINVDATVNMTRIVLPGMISKRKGSIVNISSLAGVAVSPLLSHYSAAKAFMVMFSRSLSIELADYNIHVQVQTPLFVATKLAKIQRSSLFVPSAAGYARAAVAAIGYENEISPYWAHALQLYLISFIPEWVIEGTLIKWSHYGIRKAGMKKEARLAAEAAAAASGDSVATSKPKTN